MRRADRNFSPARPTRSARDRRLIWQRRVPVNAQGSLAPFELDLLTIDRPELAPVTRGILSVAIQLIMMLPRIAVEHLVEAIVRQLDLIDGDPESEPIDEREAEDME